MRTVKPSGKIGASIYNYDCKIAMIHWMVRKMVLMFSLCRFFEPPKPGLPKVTSTRFWVHSHGGRRVWTWEIDSGKKKFPWWSCKDDRDNDGDDDEEHLLSIQFYADARLVLSIGVNLRIMIDRESWLIIGFEVLMIENHDWWSRIMIDDWESWLMIGNHHW